MTTGWPGRYVDGLTAAVHEVVVQIEDGALVGTAAAPPAGDPSVGAVGARERGELFRWPALSMDSEALAGGLVKITCRGVSDAAVTTDGVVAWTLGLTGARGPGDAGRRAHRRHLALAFGVGIVALAGGFYVSLTPIARAIASHVPAGVEATLGQGLAAILETQYCETKPARAAAETLATRLGAPAGTELHILDSDTVNAFTFPGGVVILTRGLLASAQGPDEVAGVLAHELEHVHLRHVMIRFVRTSMMTALWQASVGDYSGLFVIDPKTALDVANLRFSRDDERDADRGALARLDAAHIAREGFAAFFDRLRTKTDVMPAWMSSHPASAERIETIRRGGATAPAGPNTAAPSSPALSDAAWSALKAGCEKK